MHSVKKNLGLQTIYQVLNTCLPIITAPYLSRVLGAEKLGIYSYCHSIASYFLMFATLGVVNYGSKKIAMCGSDVYERSKTFWSIYLFQLFSSLLSLLVYILFLFNASKGNFTVLLIQVLLVSSAIFDISWFYFGIEKFDVTVSISTIVRVVSVVLIITCVKGESDLGVYVLIMSLSTFMSQFLLWIKLPKQIRLVKFSDLSIREHIKPNLVLFIPLMAMSIYHIMDKTMLGLLSTNLESGYYYNADKIINVPLGVISGFGTVLLPRMSSLVASKEQGKANELFTSSVDGIVCVCVAMAFGISAVSNEFVPVFFGAGYDKCIRLIVLLSPVIIIKGFSFTARSQYLIPMDKEKMFIVSVVVGAAVNLVLNVLLIPRYGSVGAVIGTLCAELSACVIQYWSIQKMISLKSVYITTVLYMVVGVIMYIAVRFVSNIFSGNILSLAIEFIVGVIVYCGGCLVIGIVRKESFVSYILSGLGSAIEKRNNISKK